MFATSFVMNLYRCYGFFRCDCLGIFTSNFCASYDTLSLLVLSFLLFCHFLSFRLRRIFLYHELGFYCVIFTCIHCKISYQKENRGTLFQAYESPNVSFEVKNGSTPEEKSNKSEFKIPQLPVSRIKKSTISPIENPTMRPRRSLRLLKSVEDSRIIGDNMSVTDQDGLTDFTKRRKSVRLARKINNTKHDEEVDDKHNCKVKNKKCTAVTLNVGSTPTVKRLMKNSG